MYKTPLTFSFCVGEFVLSPTFLARKEDRYFRMQENGHDNKKRQLKKTGKKYIKMKQKLTFIESL